MVIEIVLESENYRAGDQIKGYVRLTFTNLQALQGIRINFVGEAITRWNERVHSKDGQGKSHVRIIYYNGDEEYYKANYFLLGPTPSKNERIELQPGTHIYPFSFQLPHTVPPNYEGKWGSVRYIITATLVIPWALDVVQETKLNVTSPLDLNTKPEYAQPFVLTNSKTFCCFCCSSDPLKIEVTIPVTGYVPGQNIPLTIDCENKSDYPLDGIEFRLVRNVVFNAESSKSKQQKREKDLISTINVGPLPGEKSIVFRNLLEIPFDTVPHLQYCNIITIEYKIEMVAEPSGCHASLKGKIPICLGTIGLGSFQSPPTDVLEMNNISLTMGGGPAATNVPSSNIGWTFNGGNQKMATTPGDYNSLQKVQYPPLPPYEHIGPPMMPSAPALDQ